MVAPQVSAVTTIFLPIRPAKSAAHGQSSTINSEPTICIIRDNSHDRNVRQTDSTLGYRHDARPTAEAAAAEIWALRDEFWALCPATSHRLR
jgi:hypothetical protein